MENDMVTHLKSFIAVAEACHRPVNPSYSWHILDWMAWRSRCRWPLIRKCDQIINLDYTGS